MILCENGHENEDGATYCKVCHVYIDSTTAPQPTPAFTPPQVILSTDAVTLAPGGKSTISGRITNVGAAPDDYLIEIIGEASEWASVTPWTVALDPGAEATVSVDVLVPDIPAPPPGGRKCMIRVRSEAHPEQPVTTELSIEVAETEIEASASLEPESATGRGRTRHVVTVSNHGSVPFAAGISAFDDSGSLRLRVRPERVDVASGGRATSTVLAAHPRRGFFAKDEPSYGFEVTVSPEGAEPTALTGETIAAPRSIGRPALLILIIGALVGLFLFLNGRDDGPPRVTGRVATQVSPLRVRTGPGQLTDAVGRIPKGEEVVIDCRTGNGWLRLIEPFEGRFVFGGFVDVEGVPRIC
jgi:hypothetical protein